MKNKFYSPSTGGFYAPELRSEYEAAGNWPHDAVEKTPEEEAALRVIVVSPLPYADQAAAYLATVRATREAILNRLAGFGMAAVIAGDMTTAQTITAARQELLDITTITSVASATSIDVLKAAIQVEYHRIAAGVPETVRTAFENTNL